ncbi:hypothetical protein KAI87_08660 [Myxococcota bacterium]|nr:hypothetical protein [Myxococcota bacterium]
MKTSVSLNLFIVCSVFAITACEKNAVPEEIETPKEQFVLEGVRLEQKREGGETLHATATTLKGDLENSLVSDVQMEVNDGKGGVYRLNAPEGELELDTGGASFRNIVIVGPQGAELRAETANYSQTDKMIRAEGSLRFKAQGLSAEATSADVHVKDGSVFIKGPIEGRYRAEPVNPEK